MITKRSILLTAVVLLVGAILFVAFYFGFGNTCLTRTRHAHTVAQSLADPSPDTAGSDAHTEEMQEAVPEAFPPIDLVVTWVDGTDPVRNALRESYRTDTIDFKHDGRAEETEDGILKSVRYQEMDHLRYMLRSAGTFAPWIRHIYILASGDQEPEWLQPNQDRISIVYDHDIMDAEAIPTFNSHALECSLHRIPGLSEVFLYACDDMYFARPVEPSLFVNPENGHMRVLMNGKKMKWTKKPGEKMTMHEHSLRNNAALMKDVDPNIVFKKPAHQLQVMSKSIMQEIENGDGILSAAWRHTVLQKFRSEADVHPASLVAHYAMAKGVAERVSYDTCYVSTSNFNPYQMFQLNVQFTAKNPYLMGYGEHSILNRKTLERHTRFRNNMFPWNESVHTWENPKIGAFICDDTDADEDNNEAEREEDHQDDEKEECNT